MPRALRAKLAILGALLVTGPAVAQFGSFGEPPRPPSSVPTRQRSPAQPLPPPGQYPGQYIAPSDQLPPPPGHAGPLRGPGSGVESQPLPPPPGGLSDPGRAPGAPSPQPASLPPGPGSPPSSPGASVAPTPPGSPTGPYEEVVTEMPSQKVPNPTAIFSGLDKITGRITTFDVAVNETVQFGALRVRPRACYTRPPTEAPNTTGFVEVDEVTLQGEVKRLFRGWMFAASPGLHGVEHSIYDVWLADCKGAATAAIEEPAPPPQAPQRAQSAGAPAAPRAGAPRQSSAAPQRQPRQPAGAPGAAPQRAPLPPQ